MNVYAERPIARCGRGQTPTAPTASEVDKKLTRPTRRAVRPCRNWVFGKAPSNGPIKIPVGVYDPIVHERVHRAGRVQSAMTHVSRTWFAAWVICEDRNSHLHAEGMIAFTKKSIIRKQQFGSVEGARQSSQKPTV